MSTNNSGILTVVLKALLDGKTINRKDYNNGSLHSWISSLRNERYIPIETDMKNSDGTCDYYMFPEEIVRFREPELRKKQEAEMRLIVERERQQNFIDQFLEFLKRLIEYPSLWGYWDELPFRLVTITRFGFVSPITVLVYWKHRLKKQTVIICANNFRSYSQIWCMAV